MESRRIPSSAVLKYTMIGALLLFMIQGSHCFTLPGGATAKDYSKGDLLEVKVNSLTSTTTQLPYPYYSLPFCQSLKIVVDIVESFDELLRGDHIQNSPYVFRMLEPEMCNVVCRVELDDKTIDEFKAMIDNEYQVNMILDDLPLVRRISIPTEEFDRYDTVYQFGFRVGIVVHFDVSEEKMFFINNHLVFTVKYHRHPLTDKSQIVGFEVKTFSVEHEYEGLWNETTPLTTCKESVLKGSSGPLQSLERAKQVIFTYDVEFQETDIKWAARWDAYILLLSGMIAIILPRTLYVDLSKYNELGTQEASDETGWKVVHGDVFRPPSNSDQFCIFVGSGVQLLGTIALTILLAVLGFISLPNRNSLRMTVLLLWVFMGYSAGYASVRLHKMFGGTRWKKVALKTGLMFPSTGTIGFYACFWFTRLIYSSLKSV